MIVFLDLGIFNDHISHCTLDQAERRSSCSSVAESGLVDTVALLAWVAGCLEDEDSHNLATTVSRAACYEPIGGGEHVLCRKRLRLS